MRMKLYETCVKITSPHLSHLADFLWIIVSWNGQTGQLSSWKFSHRSKFRRRLTIPFFQQLVPSP